MLDEVLLVDTKDTTALSHLSLTHRLAFVVGQGVSRRTVRFMPLLVVTRYVITDLDASHFTDRLDDALVALSDQPGCRRGFVGRSPDDPNWWVMHTEWESIGAYRRALSAQEVKLRAVPVMYHAVDEPTAYEALLETGPDRHYRMESDRASDASTAGPSR
ncbi:MAG: antibiotic biosynthesis monooxygenase family protein [Actinomycetota bacterium]